MQEQRQGKVLLQLHINSYLVYHQLSTSKHNSKWRVFIKYQLDIYMDILSVALREEEWPNEWNTVLPVLFRRLANVT